MSASRFSILFAVVLLAGCASSSNSLTPSRGSAPASLSGAASASARRSAQSQPSSAGDPGPGNWPALGRTNAHSGLVEDNAMTPAAARTLGVRWMANLHAADLGSPIVAYDPTLATTVVYAGNERGDVFAFNETTGALIWSTNVGVGQSERDTPLYVNGTLYIGTAYASSLYALNAATGQILCRSRGPASFLASPMAAAPGGMAMVYDSTIDEVGFSGPFYGFHQGNCAQAFSFTGYVRPSGPWASPSFGVDANGRALVVFGTADPDSKEYALDAETGQLDWVFAVYNPPPGAYDIGAAADISAVGVNGFADGVVYFPTKYGIMYALDLTTGQQIWKFDFNADAGATEGGLSTPALVGDDLVFGYNGGLYDLNATSGAKKWRYQDPSTTEVIASPAVAGPFGNEVVGFSDIGGSFRAIARANGTPLYAYQTHGYISASPAESNGAFFITSSDGYLYAFAPGGSNGVAPTTAITSPARGATARGSSVTIAGTATGAAVSSVAVAIQSGGPAGPWYDAATGTWNLAPVDNPATLTPSATGATWKFVLPLQPDGGALTVFANAAANGVADTTGATVSFASKPGAGAPSLTATPSTVAPGAAVEVSGAGFAGGETVTFALASATIGTAAAAADGSVSASLAIPANAAFGASSIVATGSSSGTATSVALDVLNSWSQLGFDGTRAAFEPNDDVLVRVLHTGPDVFLKRAYYVPASGAVESSPAIVNGIAYYGDDAGITWAVDTTVGSPVWRHPTSPGKKLRSAPAVDGSSIYIGSDDGTLYAIRASDGSSRFKTEIGGLLGSPAAGGGAVYVASRDGTVAAVSETTGATIWKKELKAAVASPVSFDGTAGIVIVTDVAGWITAFSAADGSRLWHVAIGGAIDAAASISGGVVYAGSTNGTVVALAETNGQPLWSFAEGSAVRTTPSIAAGEPGFTGNAIYVGSDDGHVTALDSSGTAVWHVPFGAPVAGVASTKGNVVLVTLANGVVAATRGPNDGYNFFSYQTAAALDTIPAIDSGAVYVGAEDGGLYVFTPYGNLP